MLLTENFGIIFAVLSVVVNLIKEIFTSEDIKFALKGKRIAVLGLRQVGKTTLLTYIEKGILIQTYEATLVPKTVERKWLKLPDLDIRFRKTRDVAGSSDADVRNEWKKLCKESDIILYIVRTDMLLCGDKKAEVDVEKDLRNIGGWVKDSNKKVVIVGNHWNTDSEYRNLTPDKEGVYVDRFKALPFVQNMTLLAGGVGNVKVALGSLESTSFAERLISRIFTQVL